MSSYDGNHGTIKKWIPKKSMYSPVGQQQVPSKGRHGSNPRSLVNNNSKSFSEGYNSFAQVEQRTVHPKMPHVQSFRGSAPQLSAISPSSSPSTPHFYHPSHRGGATMTTTTSTTTTTQYVIPVPKSTRHKRSASDPFKDDPLTPMAKVVTHSKTTSTSTSPIPQFEMCEEEEDRAPKPIRRERSGSWGNKHGNQKRNKRSVLMVDACTQTTNDIGTQVFDNFEEDDTLEEDYIIQAAQLLLRSAREKKEKKMRLGVKSMSFNGPTELPPPSERDIQGSETDIWSDLNDLEEEIAMMRFKAMSLQEQMKWLNQEKSARPNAPVDFDVSGQSPKKYPSPFGSLSTPPKAFSPPQMEVSAPVALKATPTIEFTDSKPIVERCLSPLSLLTPIKATQDSTRGFQVASPDASKRTEIGNSNAKSSSAFSGFGKPSSPAYLNKTGRLTKSLSSLPEVPQ